MAFNFISPSTKFATQDLSVVSAALGITTLGLVGETTQGPAFQSTFIANMNQFRSQFGGLSNKRLPNGNLKYLLPYYASSYLSQSNQMYVTRILGLSGYQAGPAWGLTLSAALNPATSGVTLTTTGNTTFTGSTFLGQTITAQTGITQNIPLVYTKIQGTTQFTGVSTNFIINNLVFISGQGYSGQTSYTAITYSGTSYSQYENLFLGNIRSRGTYNANSLAYQATGVTISLGTALNNMLGTFTLSATGYAGTYAYTATLNPNLASYLPNVVGSSSKDKNTQIFVEDVYPDLINWLAYNNYGYGINATLIEYDTSANGLFATQYTAPQTPFIVSELRGSSLTRLFYFESIPDGNSANKLFKISFQNIDPSTGNFDIIIRAFGDTDANPVILESYSNCNLIKTSNQFVGSQIGDNNINFPNQSDYVYIVWDNFDTLDQTAFPAGFEGYNFRSYGPGNTVGSTAQTPTIQYKTSYLSTDKLSRTYLGISERAYDTASIGTGFNPDFFKFYGNLSAAGIVKTKGFHLDSGATGTYYEGSTYIGQFITGYDQFQTAYDTQNPANGYYNIQTRKFTLAPYGGFDGWDIYENGRTNTAAYATGGIYHVANNDFDAYSAAINTFSNPDDTVINLFATPGIDWSNNLALVNIAIDLIENVRKDSFYVIDAPYLPNTTAMAQDYAELLSTTSIDSNYSATYAPWIQFKDNDNNVNIYIPATGEVMKNAGLTDNVAYPWFAIAGQTRGLVNSPQPVRKVNLSERDTLYAARINPIAFSSTVGTDIMGQKTLQVKNSQLNRVNVRRLLLYLQQMIAQISASLLFEQNDSILTTQFLNKLNPLLNSVVVNRGLSDYKIEYQSINTPESMAQNQLYFNLYLKPIGALEFVGITFIISPAGASFQNV